MEPLRVLQNKARHLRGLIQNNCDDKFNWIDAELGERLLADLKATNKRTADHFEWRGLHVGQLGWSREETQETYWRLQNFADDWDAPGMEAYDDL